jgi:hypothetical protein
MDETRNMYTILFGKARVKRSLGSHRCTGGKSSKRGIGVGVEIVM